MSGNTTANTQALIRAELYQDQLEETLYEHLMNFAGLVRQIDFPDGNQFTMPSVGTPVTRDLPEGSEVIFDNLDSGEVSITMNQPIVTANKLSEVLIEDSLWSSELLSRIPLDQAIAIMERVESDIFALANQQFGGQNNANTINGVAHRKVASGTNETIAAADFAFAKYSLLKAKVPTSNLVAIVDPSVAYALETSTNLVNVSNNPQWEGVIAEGINKEFRFVKNVYGFDVFESNLLPDANETIGGLTTTAGKANIFTSMARPGISPFVQAWRRKANLKSWIDDDTGDLKTKTTARYGTGLVRDENLVVILSDTDQVV
ncbi:MAG: hypothetical protein V3S69_05300 [Dehalococcoidales bacterium]